MFKNLYFLIFYYFTIMVIIPLSKINGIVNFGSGAKISANWILAPKSRTYPKWQDIVIEIDSKGIQRVNRINYEIAV
ncbi:hypothetical protein ACQVTU_29475 [Bacillus cereus]|uniref:hypothetical protein n=1 Tax=Bacillus TaxID=1386 RepID=UPI000BEE2112|nr:MULTISPECIES: hypothetical protein [Bacillus cereus group]AZR80511.1 hypothetical protein BtSCAC15_30555 [Bacillus thuringiensis]MBG9522133.1 hypothetical protein [Bacillus thuringiensis]PDZ46981.1 hypothetical protein CON82_04875 [Bacillus wiedmannii]HDR3896907.1 hypothetical protein [Bacillus cereus]